MEQSHSSHGGSVALPRRIKASLASGSSVLGIYSYVGGFYLNNFFLEIACLDPVHVGVIQMVQCVFDACNDPLIGYLSDRTRTSIGRRRPWLFAGGPLVSVAYVLLYQAAPSDWAELSRVTYHLVTYMGISVATTMVELQVHALVPELTSDYDERSVCSAYRILITNVVGGAAVALHATLLSHIRPLKLACLVSALILGALMWVCAWIPALVIREPPRSEAPAPEAKSREPELGLVEGLRLVATNRAFVFVCILQCLGPMAIFTLQSNLVMYCKYVLQNEAMVAILIPTLLLVAQPFVLFWVAFSRRFNKRAMAMSGYSILSLCAVALPFIPAEQSWLLTLVVAGVGTALCVPYFVPLTMLPDVIEEDEMRCGRRREGVFSGFFCMPLKLAIALTLIGTNGALKAAGYSSPQSSCGALGAVDLGMPDSQPDAVLRVLSYLVGPIPASMLCLAAIVAYFFPITRDRHLENVRALSLRRSSAGSRGVDGEGFSRDDAQLEAHPAEAVIPPIKSVEKGSEGAPVFDATEVLSIHTSKELQAEQL